MSELSIIAPLVPLEDIGALTPTGLDLDPEGLSYERFEAIGNVLGKGGNMVRWAVGDWLLLGEAAFGQKLAQAAEVVGLSPETLGRYRWVADRVAPRRRRMHVPWSLHQLIAKLDPEQQERWLARAESDRLTHRELDAQLRAALPAAHEPQGATEQPAWSEGSPLAPGAQNGAQRREDSTQKILYPKAPPAEEYVDLELAARECVRMASARRRGERYHYEVPAEAFDQLRAALGERSLLG